MRNLAFFCSLIFVLVGCASQPPKKVYAKTHFDVHKYCYDRGWGSTCMGMPDSAKTMPSQQLTQYDIDSAVDYIQTQQQIQNNYIDNQIFELKQRGQ